jgi:hypothetical protein
MTDLNVIAPVTITDANLVSSNVAETDHPAWSASTTYAVGARVILTATHSVYEAVTVSTNANPATNAAWARVGATNRWKAFDGRTRDRVTRAGSIQYVFAVTSRVSGVAAFELTGGTFRVRVTDAAGAARYDKTHATVDKSGIIDWLSYFTWEPDPSVESLIDSDVVALPGDQITVTLAAPIARLGQLVIGRKSRLGQTTEGTTGFTDFSRKEYDEFGNPILIQRPYALRVDYSFVFPRSDAQRVKRTIANLRATPAVYFVDDIGSELGLNLFGFLSGDLEILINAEFVTFATLEIEGLI